ncbi:MAG: TetR/AcrR family transcriptional regulator [Thaumarchaeota archaeon]|nr:TetR/AcrR family transcriptional regulator [Nitrososphaerota archaeon]
MVTRKDIVKERILTVAMKVFSKYGYFGAPVQLVAKEADVSKGLVFWYFRSKDELILEVAKRSLPLDLINRGLEKGLVGRSLLESIGEEYIKKYVDPMQRNLLLHTMSLGVTSPDIAVHIREICERTIIRLAERVFGEATLPNRVAMRAFLGGLMCYTLRPPKDIDEKTFLENLINMVLSVSKQYKNMDSS